jgi:16S rRNA pseudouridine516 synthase
MRLDKYLSESSIGRRKAVRIYVKEGKVKVNGQVVTIPAQEIDENNDMIEYLDQKVEHNGKVYYMFHKPSGCVTARSDEKDKTVFDYFKDMGTDGLFPVGRLDKDTEGLLFITNDGEFNHQLMYPDKHVDKIYYFWAFGSLEEEQIRQIEAGISINDEEPLTKPATLKVVRAGLFSELKDEIQGTKYEKVKKNRDVQPVLSGYITISEGRKHQVKRMLRAFGCYVIYLKRISIGDVALDESLEKGQYRSLTEEEVKSLFCKE